jgi:uncharacterized membrane protein
MKQSRLEALTDGVFAIVMTLLVIDVRVPLLTVANSNTEALHALRDLLPVFISYVLSFVILFTYWRGHHYTITTYIKNIDFKLTSINAAFFFLISLIPFSAHFLGEYPENQVAVIFYSVHIILISLTLSWMRHHIRTSKFIERVEINIKSQRNIKIRNAVPFTCSILAIILSFYNTHISIIVLTAAILFNLHPTITDVVHWFWDKIAPEEKQIIA